MARLLLLNCVMILWISYGVSALPVNNSETLNLENLTSKTTAVKQSLQKKVVELKAKIVAAAAALSSTTAPAVTSSAAASAAVSGKVAADQAVEVTTTASVVAVTMEAAAPVKGNVKEVFNSIQNILGGPPPTQPGQPGPEDFVKSIETWIDGQSVESLADKLNSTAEKPPKEIMDAIESMMSGRAPNMTMPQSPEGFVGMIKKYVGGPDVNISAGMMFLSAPPPPPEFVNVIQGYVEKYAKSGPPDRINATEFNNIIDAVHAWAMNNTAFNASDLPPELREMCDKLKEQVGSDFVASLRLPNGDMSGPELADYLVKTRNNIAAQDFAASLNLPSVSSQELQDVVNSAQAFIERHVSGDNPMPTNITGEQVTQYVNDMKTRLGLQMDSEEECITPEDAAFIAKDINFMSKQATSGAEPNIAEIMTEIHNRLTQRYKVNGEIMGNMTVNEVSSFVEAIKKRIDSENNGVANMLPPDMTDAEMREFESSLQSLAARLFKGTTLAPMPAANPNFSVKDYLKAIQDRISWNHGDSSAPSPSAQQGPKPRDFVNGIASVLSQSLGVNPANGAPLGVSLDDVSKYFKDDQQKMQQTYAQAASSLPANMTFEQFSQKLKATMEKKVSEAETNPCASMPCQWGQVCRFEPKQCITSPCPQHNCYEPSQAPAEDPDEATVLVTAWIRKMVDEKMGQGSTQTAHEDTVKEVNNNFDTALSWLRGTSAMQQRR